MTALLVAFGVGFVVGFAIVAVLNVRDARTVNKAMPSYCWRPLPEDPGVYLTEREPRVRVRVSPPGQPRRRAYCAIVADPAGGEARQVFASYPEEALRRAVLFHVRRARRAARLYTSGVNQR